MSDPPVDLSFQNISKMSGTSFVQPRSGLRPVRKNSEMKYLSGSLRLSYNSIQDLTGLEYVLDHFLAAPSKIGWLDLSFNKIECIHPVLCELRELRVLYLHANNISRLSEVDKLRELQFLHTITLHGNPIELVKGYRSHVICALPQLKKIDFSVVTREERVLANAWSHCNNRGKNNKERPQ